MLSVVVGLFFYLAARENPDYVRAAKRLPEARMKAQSMFGPLTWDEYPAQEGIDPEADLALWQKVVDSIPVAVTSYVQDPGGSGTTRQNLFQQEQRWFENADTLIADLRWWHGMNTEHPGFGSEDLLLSKSIVQALSVGIVGAAERGDAEAVLKLGRSVNRVVEEILVEPVAWPVLVARANRSILCQALIRAAVRNRDDQAVQDSVRQILEELPVMPTVREHMGGELRSIKTFIEFLRPLSPGQVDEQLNERWGLKEEDLRSSFLDRATKFWGRITGEEDTGAEPWMNRRTGSSTVDALDARVLEVLVRTTELMEAVEHNDTSARALLERPDWLLNESIDRSYELVWSAPTGTTSIDAHLRAEFHDRAALAAFGLIDRFPRQDDLPDELPADLQFPDPFGGEPAHYVKTATGFLIFTVGSDYNDAGYKPSHPDILGSEVRFTTGLIDGQWAYIISYDPIVREP